jgi:hypothetical protein
MLIITCTQKGNRKQAVLYFLKCTWILSRALIYTCMFIDCKNRIDL